MQLVTAQMPLFTKQCALGHWTDARRRMIKMLIIGTSLHTFVALSLYFISPIVVDWWIGPGHYIEGSVLLALTINYLITSVASLPGHFVLAAGRNPFAQTTILHGILTVLGMILLCPMIGLLGVPIASLAAVFLTNLWKNPLEAWRMWKSLKRNDNPAYQP